MAIMNSFIVIWRVIIRHGRGIMQSKLDPDLAFPLGGTGENVMGASSSPVPLRVTGDEDAPITFSKN